jgi:hypothetical protein
MGKIQIIIITILTLAIGSCTEEVTPLPNQYSKVFTGTNSKTWKVKFLESTLNGKIDDTFTIACASDDEYIFFANPERAYQATTGTRKCDTNESNTINDSWSFNNASATLTMVLPFFTESSLPFIVREAKKNTLELEIFRDQENTSSYRIHLESSKEN